MSSAPRPTTPDEILAHLVEQRLEGLASRFGNEALAWLAVTPTWTEPAASAASFPSRNIPLARFLDEASEQGLVDRDPPLRVDKDLGRVFWISENDRGPVLEFLRRKKGFGPAKLTEITVHIARQLEHAQASTPLPDELRYWLDLAKRAQEPFEVARQLGDDVSALTRDRKTGEALARVDAGRSLAQTLGTTHLDAAIGVGSRRIGLAYRQAADGRHLKRYFPRDEQHKAFEALLDPLSPAWALHYLGVGGAGKTMLMRWITTPQDADGRPGPERVVSRIDFDDLKPEYPVRKPGQLLLDLAVELRSFGRTTHEEQLFKTINDTVQDLHAILGVAPPPANPLFNVQRPEFDRILRPFCDLVRVLPQPVVLILDTCEELARVPVVNGVLPSIEATFSILERVHREVPSLRVIFAGRRPIASSGHEWHLRGAGTWEVQRGFRQFLTPRPYLAIHEVRGVTFEDAQAFLQGRLGRPLTTDLEQAVCTRSLDLGRAADIVYTGRGIRTVSTGARYSLFDLALYADWLHEDPGLDAARIASGTSDPYVDLRIVQRVKQPAIRAALPAIAALGRFDAPTLRGAFPSSLTDVEYDAVYREIGDYEWIELQRESGSSDKLFLEVDRNLLPRIRSYFEQPSRRFEAAQAVASLVPGLSSFIRRTRLGDLSPSHLSAALTILPPAEAARLWVEVLLRLRTQADLTWLRTATERQIGVEFEAARQGPLERGLDLAAEIVAMLSGSPRSQPPVVQPPAWSDGEGQPREAPDGEVQRRAWPDEGTAAWIDRVSLDPSRPFDSLPGILKNFRFVPKCPGPVLAPTRLPDDVLARRMSEEEVGWMVDVLERYAGRQPPASASRPRFERIEELAQAVEDWTRALQAHEYPADLVGMAQMLTAKLCAVAGRGDSTRRWCQQALETAVAVADEPGGLWLFWRSPDTPCDRIRHELLLLHEDVPLDSFPDPRSWLPAALSRNASIDGERLASAIERHLLHRGLPQPSERAISEFVDDYVRERVPVTTAHRETPPLFVTLAMKQGALASFEAADAALQTRALVAEKDGDIETVWKATMARVELARLSRQMPRDLPTVVARMSPEIKRRTFARGICTARALLGLDLTEGFKPDAHEIWRSTVIGSEAQRLEAIADFEARWREGVPLNSAMPVSLSDALDGLEAMRLGSQHHRVLSYPGPGPSIYVEHADGLLRGLLRLYALDPLPTDPLDARVEISAPLFVLLFRERDVEPDVRVSDLVQVVREIARSIDDGAFKIAPAERKKPRDDWQANAVRLVDHFGIRRWAAVAQEEGELVALRLPHVGTRLLQFAEMLAIAASDPQARLAAATTASLASVRTGVDESAPPADHSLEEAWTLAAGADAWRAIDRAVHDLQEPFRTGGDAPPPGPLPPRGGWAARTVIALLARTPDGSLLTRRAQLFPNLAASPEVALLLDRTVERKAGEAPAAPAAPEPERPLWFVKTVTTGLSISLVALWIYAVRINAFGPTGTPTPSSTRFFFPLLGVAGAFAAAGLLAGRSVLRFIVGAIVLVFVSMCFCYWAIGSVADLLIRDSLMAGRLSQSWRVAAMFAVIFGLTALEPAVKRLRAKVARRSNAAAWIESGSSGADLRSAIAASAWFDVRVSCTIQTIRFPFLLSRKESEESLLVEISALRPYADMAAAIAKDAALEPLVEVRSALGHLLWPVSIQSGAATYQPWEAVLGVAVAPSRLTSDASGKEPVFFYRWGPARPGSARADAWGQGHVDVRGAQEADGWGDRVILESPGFWTRLDHIGRPARSVTTIVHAVGTPVMTSLGPRLDLADKSGFLDPKTLPENLPLLILHQQPADSHVRVTTDREQAALMRALAGDLFESTCDAVIVIPSLPPELADSVVKGLARELSAGPLGFDAFDRWLRPHREPRRGWLALLRLATAVRGARDLVLQAQASGRVSVASPDLPDAREAAWDFCLFARPREPGGEMHIERPSA